MTPTLTTAQGRILHCLTTRSALLTEYIAETAGITAEESLGLVSIGAVYVDRRRPFVDQFLSPGHYLRVHLRPKRYPADRVGWASVVVHWDPEFVVVNKPPGIPVHATLDNRIENALFQLNSLPGAPFLITQRLDVDVSGLIVFARTPEFQRSFNQLLIERRLRKRYRALVTSPPRPGWHTHYMQPSERMPKTVIEEPRPNWPECVLRVGEATPVGLASAQLFEAEIELKTGRTHQIRAQLSALGSPLVGDSLYGSNCSYAAREGISSAIALCSTAISWTSIDGRQHAFTLEPPWRNT